VLLPFWEATIVHVPVPTNEAVMPDTVHTLEVVEANVTASPELAVALSVTVPPTVCAGIALKVIVCV
jgi:hypothetical protein